MSAPAEPAAGPAQPFVFACGAAGASAAPEALCYDDDCTRSDGEPCGPAQTPAPR